MTIDNAISDFEKMMKHQEDTAAYNIRHGGTEYAKMAKANKKKALEYRQLAEWLKELKQLREQTRWIPVSEKLPEDPGNYLTAIADSNYTNGQWFKISWFYPGVKEWSYRKAAVIAWMPLPEPYNPVQALKYADNPTTESALAPAT